MSTLFSILPNKKRFDRIFRYVKEGLINNNFYSWIISESLDVIKVEEALRTSVSCFAIYVEVRNITKIREAFKELSPVNRFPIASNIWRE